mmetsp:Transcript_12472/g.36221  ORF Transcript_12472/g.36221 Transcript_12472/m.36221 type:complete len:125 (-) Transcript_12472:363-737(-)
MCLNLRQRLNAHIQQEGQSIDAKRACMRMPPTTSACDGPWLVSHCLSAALALWDMILLLRSILCGRLYDWHHVYIVCSTCSTCTSSTLTSTTSSSSSWGGRIGVDNTNRANAHNSQTCVESRLA